MIEIPGYEEAIASERRDRSRAFLALPEIICGVEVEPLTALKLDWLKSVHNGFVCDSGDITPADVLQFVWILKPGFDWRDTEGRQRFIEEHALVDFETELQAIEAYLETTFLDAPPPGKASIPYYSLSAWLVWRMRKLDWKTDETLNAPLRIIYQILKVDARQNGGTCYNRRSDAVRDKWLTEINSGRGTN